jgi:glyoxylate/hydroxypyruvate reductase
MQVVVSAPAEVSERWRDGLAQAAPELDFVLWPEVADGDAEAIEAAVVWNAPPELYARCRHLKCICVLGAGTDQLFAPGIELPEVPIVRIVDPVMALRMASYVLAAILHFQRDFHDYVRQQRERVWRKHRSRDSHRVRVGVMGLGAMGRASAKLLVTNGYDVAGWSRSPRRLPGVEGFAGEDGWPPFLARCDYLACLLPLTAETRGLLGVETFARLPEGAVVINAGRGAHLVEADLLAALDAGRLRGAVLDVFETEPLPPEHPFWDHPRILLTPHVASITNLETGVVQIAAALRTVRDGGVPVNLVDRARGY